jgi:hypothetical protein
MSVLACGESTLEPKGDGLPTGPDAVIGRLEDAQGRPLVAEAVSVNGAIDYTDENGVFAFDSVPSEYTLAVDLAVDPLRVFAGMTSRRPTIRVRWSGSDVLAHVTVSLAPSDRRTEILVVGQTTQAFRDQVVAFPGVYPAPAEPTDIQRVLTWGTETPAAFALAALEFEFDPAFHVRSTYQTAAEPLEAIWYQPVTFTRVATTTLTLEPGGSESWVPDFVPVGTREVSIVTPDYDGGLLDQQFVYARLPGTDQLTIINENLGAGDTQFAILPDLPGVDFFLIAHTSTPPAYQGAGCATLVPIPTDADTMELIHGTPPELVSPEDGANIGNHGELVTGITGPHTIRVEGAPYGTLEIHSEQPSITLPELSYFGWTWDPEVDFHWQVIVDTPATELEALSVPAVPHEPIGRATSIANESGETCQSDWRIFRVTAP